MKKYSLWKILTFFVILETLFIWVALFCWGFYGQVGPQRFKAMVQYSTQKQKQTLSDALNFYYNKGFAKYTTGYILRCEPNTESIMQQFMWFHRNTLTYYVKDNASYHEVLLATLQYFDLLTDENNTVSLSTYYLESLLGNWQKRQKESLITGKDKSSLLITLLDTGGTFFLSGSSPVGATVSVLNLLHKAGSDPAKCIPAIVVFKQQRETNFLWTASALTIFNLFFIFIVFRKKQ